ncbi:MAG TPA: hypothetical protein VGM23_05540, partial [Armatimonadota bacterium]
TLSNSRLVITTFGKTTDLSPNRIYLVDAKSGDTCAWVGANRQFKETFRLTGPASITFAQMELDATGFEGGYTPDAVTQVPQNTYNPGMSQLRRETVEMLVAPGEYIWPADPNANTGQPSVFLIPAMFNIRLSPPVAPLPQSSSIPRDMRLVLGDNPLTTDISKIFYFQANAKETTAINALPLADQAAMRDQKNRFRKSVLVVKQLGFAINIIFRRWDNFFRVGTATSPMLSFPLHLVYTPDATTVRPGAVLSTQAVVFPKDVKASLQLAMGYPIFLQSTQHYPLGGRLTLRPFDGDGVNTFGYQVDAPPLIYRDQLIAGTNSAATSGFPLLRDSAQPQPLKPIDMEIGGSLTGIRLMHPGLSKAAQPMSWYWDGDMSWQFFGDTAGPRGAAFPAGYAWKSDFPYQAAVSKDTVYSVAAYNGYGNVDGTGYYQLPPTQLNRGMLYALDPRPARYLQQTVAVGAGAAPNSGLPRVGYQDPDSGVTFIIKQDITLTYSARITQATATGYDFQWSTNGGTSWTNGTTNGSTQVALDAAVSLLIPKDVQYMSGQIWTMDATNSLYQVAIVTKDPATGKDLAPGALRVGVRILVKAAYTADPMQDFTQDLGTITTIRKQPYFDSANPCYWVTFTRPRPLSSKLIQADIVTLVGATSAPYLSHVQAWNKAAGAMPQRQYTRDGVATDVRVRLSEGICNTPPKKAENPSPTDLSATPVRGTGQLQEVMISFTGLERT